MMANGGLLKYTKQLWGDLQFYFPIVTNKGKIAQKIRACTTFIFYKPNSK
jgi:hypothetical protein